jgi:hypothetical protein
MPLGYIAAATIGGSLLSGNSAARAAETSANAQLQAGREAAEAARFRPVGITTRFGSSGFQFDPQGYLTGAGYNVSPELKAYQDRLMSLTGQGLTQAEQAQAQYAPLTGAASGLFNLGQQYLAQSPEQVAADYMAKQQALLAPGRERESAALANQLYSKGRTGLSIAQGGGLMAANPEQAALANARAMQDLQLAAQANQAGQQQVQFGQGLFGAGAGLLGNYYAGQNAALAPFQSTLGLTGTIENLGQNALDIGSTLGGRAMNTGAASALLQSGIRAAETAQPGNAYNPFASALQGFGSNPALMRSMWNNPSSSALNNSYYSQFGITPDNAKIAI